MSLRGHVYFEVVDCQTSRKTTKTSLLKMPPWRMKLKDGKLGEEAQVRLYAVRSELRTTSRTLSKWSPSSSSTSAVTLLAVVTPGRSVDNPIPARDSLIR